MADFTSRLVSSRKLRLCGRLTCSPAAHRKSRLNNFVASLMQILPIGDPHVQETMIAFERTLYAAMARVA